MVVLLLIEVLRPPRLDPSQVDSQVRAAMAVLGRFTVPRLYLTLRRFWPLVSELW